MMSNLVQRLSDGKYPVCVGGPQASLEDFTRRIKDLGYVFIKFTETRGGTDLGFRLDQNATDLMTADFDKGTGTVHVEGELTLNYVKVRCIADIDLATLQGLGHLQPLQAVYP